MLPRVVMVDREPGMLAAMDAVMREAYGNPSFASALERFAFVQPDGVAVVEADGHIVGTGCCMAYPDARFGWIGLIATRPGWERRGIGRAVTAHLVDVLARHGCGAVLDASAAGGPVYERMGFVDRGRTIALRLPAAAAGAPAASVCTALDAADLPAVTAYDAVRFGGDRRALLATAWEQRPGRAFVIRAADGSVTGYLLASGDVVGPLVADDAVGLRCLLDAAQRLPWTGEARINVPPDSGHLRALLDLGAEPLRSLRHMQLGVDQLPGRRAAVAGMLSLGEG